MEPAVNNAKLLGADFRQRLTLAEFSLNAGNDLFLEFIYPLPGLLVLGYRAAYGFAVVVDFFNLLFVFG